METFTRVTYTREALVMSDEELQVALETLGPALARTTRVMEDALARALLTPLPAWGLEPVPYVAPKKSPLPYWPVVVGFRGLINTCAV